MEFTPTPVHELVEEHKTEAISFDPEGRDCAVQFCPPLAVVMTVEPSPTFPESPTATQFKRLEQETP
jgi:hypothetical protein